jgi:hypothetical protein
MIILWAAKSLVQLMGMQISQGQLLARGYCSLSITLWVVFLTRRQTGGGLDLFDKSLLAIAAVFLLSPAQFPWYYVWIVPLLALRPRASLLLLTPLLPLYYLRPYFSARGDVTTFDNGFVWLEYLPVWALIVREFYVEPFRRVRSLAESTI